jgi:two-component system OmpR family sensor kinase/two-component system sensor histidine kinase BaeS
MLLSFALVIVLSVCGMLGFIGLAVSGRWQPAAVSEGFQSFQRNYALSLGDYYEANGDSWAGVDQRFDVPPFAGPNSWAGYALASADGRIVASNDRNLPKGTKIDPRDLKNGIPITARGAQVGTLVVGSALRYMPHTPEQPLSGRQARDLGGPIARSFLIAALILGGSLLLLAVFFAQRLSRPLRNLTAAAQQMATGQLDVQVGRAPIREVDELTQAFNGMAHALATADRQRRQMTADIAHELRTPLTIIKGRLEGLQDGVYSATPDELDRLLSETALLERLIEDLRLLALAEAGQMPLYRELIDPRDLLADTRAAFAGQASAQGVKLEVEAPDDLPPIDADPQRMAQVLANLVANALRYTPKNGVIKLSACYNADYKLQIADLPQKNGRAQSTIDNPSTALRAGLQSAIILRVSDTGTGIAAEDLPYIFDRFYRADRSRARGSGGAGLGLAIAKQIVAAHGGSIWATSAEEQGTTISIALPAAENNEDD